MYSIKIAELADIKWICEVAATKMLVEELNKPQYVDLDRIKELVFAGIGSKSMWIVLKNGLPVGALGALPVPNIFNPRLACLTEIFWWVDKEHRNGKAGLLLLNAFSDEADKYDEATMSLLTTSRVVEQSLVKRGFSLREYGFHKEKQ